MLVLAIKSFPRIYEVSETSTRSSTFTKHVETVTPPVVLSNNVLQGNHTHEGATRSTGTDPRSDRRPDAPPFKIPQQEVLHMLQRGGLEQLRAKVSALG